MTPTGTNTRIPQSASGPDLSTLVGVVARNPCWQNLEMAGPAWRCERNPTSRCLSDFRPDGFIQSLTQLETLDLSDEQSELVSAAEKFWRDRVLPCKTVTAFVSGAVSISCIRARPNHVSLKEKDKAT